MDLVRQTGSFAGSFVSSAAERTQTARVTSSIKNFEDRLHRFETEEFNPLHQKSQELRERISKLETEKQEGINDLKNGCALHKSFLEQTTERVQKLEENLTRLEKEFKKTFPEKEMVENSQTSSKSVRDLISTFDSK